MSTMTGAFGGGFDLTSQRAMPPRADSARATVTTTPTSPSEDGWTSSPDFTASTATALMTRREKRYVMSCGRTLARNAAPRISERCGHNATTLSSERPFAWDNVGDEL